MNLWSSPPVEWGGLNFTIRTPPASTYVLTCRPTTLASAWTERMLSGQSTMQTTSTASDVTVVTVTQNWSLCCNVKCVSPTGCLFRALQAASNDCPWDIYRHFALFRIKGMLAYVRSWLRATVAVNLCETCVRSPHCPQSCHWTTEKRHLCWPTQSADMNDASQQPTSRQNRRSEVAGDAGTVRKWRTTALTVAQCVDIAWVISTWSVINSITSYVLKTSYQLETGLPVTVLTSLSSTHSPSHQERMCSASVHSEANTDKNTKIMWNLWTVSSSATKWEYF